MNLNPSYMTLCHFEVLDIHRPIQLLHPAWWSPKTIPGHEIKQSNKQRWVHMMRITDPVLKSTWNSSLTGKNNTTFSWPIRFFNYISKKFPHNTPFLHFFLFYINICSNLSHSTKYSFQNFFIIGPTNRRKSSDI
jgi:hypothetical protein